MIEQRYVMTGYDLVSELEHVINLILAYPQGLSILLGKVDAPESSAIVLAFPPASYDNLGIRGQFVPEAERVAVESDRLDKIIKQAGGWSHITGSVQKWRERHRTDWSMMAMHISYVRSKKRSLDGPTLEKIANMYDTTKERVCRARKNFAWTIADFVLYAPIDDDLEEGERKVV